MGIIALTCPPDAAHIRLNRILADDAFRPYRDETHIATVEDLIADEAADIGDDPFGPNIPAIIDLADVRIDALPPTTVVHAQADAFVDQFRPSQQM